MIFFFKLNNMKYWHPHLPFGQHISVSTLALRQHLYEKKRKLKQLLSTIPPMSTQQKTTSYLRLFNTKTSDEGNPGSGLG